MKPKSSDPGSNWIVVGFLQPGGQESGVRVKWFEAAESSRAGRNIGFGGKEMHLSSPSLLSVSLVLIALTSVKIFHLPDGFPHV